MSDIMTAREYALAHDLGYAAAIEFDCSTLDRDEHRDMAHPEAFSDALDALPQCEAAAISEAVDAGIRDAWETAS